jgi:O-antigen ligase/tetratricopeptide (TPR) repeat protein
VNRPATSPAASPPTDLWSRLIEAGWLAAIVVIPTFFNSYSARSFEPDKVALLRAIAALMALCWAGRLLAERPASGRRKNRLPDGNARAAWWLAIAIVAWDAVATATSIAHDLSLNGTYARAQGLYTTAAYLVIFLSMAALITRREQVDRALTALLLASCPVAAFALIQHAGLDPVGWAGQTRRPVVSTMGNAIFLAAFMGMVLPLTVGRLLSSLAALRLPPARGGVFFHSAAAAASVAALVAAWSLSLNSGALVSLVTVSAWFAAGMANGRRGQAGAATGTLLVLAAMQLSALLFSASRGPFLGLLCAALLFALLCAAHRGHRRLVLATGGLATAIAVLFLAVQIPGSPLAFIKEVPVAGRLMNVLETGGTAKVRLLLWEQAVTTVSERPSSALTGYGPETIGLAMAPHYPPELSRYESREGEADRAHNDTYDRVIGSGLVGAALYCAFFVALLVLGLRHLDIVRSGRDARRVIVTCVGTALALAGIVLAADQSGRLLGLAVPVGLIGGVALYLTGCALCRPPPADAPRDPSALICIALLAGLASHFAETQVGIATASTRLGFYFLAGLLFGIHNVSATKRAELANLPRASVATERTSASGRKSDPGSVPPPSLAVSLALFAMVVISVSFGFISSGVDLAKDPPYGWLLRVCFFVCGLLVLTAGPLRRPRQDWRRPTALFLSAYLSVFLASVLLPILLFRWLSPLENPLHWKLATFYIVVAAMVALTARSMSARGAPRLRGSQALALGLLFPVLAVIVFHASLKPIFADIEFKRGQYALAAGKHPDRATAAFRRAVELAPREPHYQVYLSRALSDEASVASNPSVRDARYDEAATILDEARARRPSDYQFSLNLARLYALWARRTDPPDQRRDRMQLAFAHYEDAISLSPRRPDVLNGYGTALALAQRHEEAIAVFERSLLLDANHSDTYLLLGRSHFGLGDRDRARAVLEQGAREAKPSADIQVALGNLEELSGQARIARDRYEQALAIDPGIRSGYLGLIGLRLRAGDCEGARAEVDRLANALPSDPAVAQARSRLAERCARQR